MKLTIYWAKSAGVCPSATDYNDVRDYCISHSHRYITFETSEFTERIPLYHIRSWRVWHNEDGRPPTRPIVPPTKPS